MVLRISYEVEGLGAAMAHGSRRLHKFNQEYGALIESETDRLVEFTRDEAPKKTGLFAQGIRGYVGKTTGGDFFSRIQSFGEHATVGRYKLAELIIRGTKPHEIPKGGSAAQVAKGYPLRFYWENGPTGPGIYFFWSVWHPGTNPNPFTKRAMKRWRPWATRRLKKFGAHIAQP